MENRTEQLHSTLDRHDRLWAAFIAVTTGFYFLILQYSANLGNF